MNLIRVAVIASMCAASFVIPLAITNGTDNSVSDGKQAGVTASGENTTGSAEQKIEETASAEKRKEERVSGDTKEIVIEDQTVDIPVTGTKWVKVNGVMYYAKDGDLVKGLYEFTEADGEETPHYSFFDKDDGRLYTRWHKMGEAQGESVEHYSYFGDNGWMRTGLQNMGTADNPDDGSKEHQSYFDEKGWLVQNKAFEINNTLYIADNRGWAKQPESEHDKTLARAYQLVDEWTDDGMTGEEKLRICYDHIRDDFPEYNPRIPHYAGEGWDTMYANDIFVDKGGNCISVAAAVAYVAKAIGFENVYAINGSSHGWAEVDNLVYDAEWERHNDGSYFGLSYDVSGENIPVYKYIFGSDNPYARIKL